MTRSEDHIEQRTREVGREIFAHCLGSAPPVFHPDWWQQQILEWAMHDARLGVQLFRFVDVLPTLRSRRDVAAHLTDYLLHGAARLPPALERALRFASPDSLAGRAAALGARQQVGRMARRFIAGETLPEAVAAVQRLRKRRMTFTLDLLGEATTSESQADAYARRYLDLLDGLTRAASGWRAVAQTDEGPRGELPRVNVSLKLSALHSQFDPIAAEQSAAAVLQRLRGILRLARERGAFVNVDMEESRRKGLVLDTFRAVLMEDEFRDFPHAGIALQAYLKDTERDLRELVEWVGARGHPITVRLVKGAYWESETAQAVQRGWPVPVYEHKWETDAAFERLTDLLMEHHELVQPAIASHNLRSLARAIAHAEARGLSARDYELQMLYGMGDPLKAALVERGLRLRIYTPFGPLIPGMSYLIRRLLENTSNDSFLRQSFTEHVPIDELLAAPGTARSPSTPVPAAVRVDHDEDAMTQTLSNEPWTDFSEKANRDAMAAAIRHVRETRAGRDHAMVIGGAAVKRTHWIESFDPSRSDVLLGRVARACTADADRAVNAARTAWDSWRSSALEERTGLLRRVAAGMRRRRFELGAWCVLEAGKPWREADADVAEAIDFCEFYAAEMERLERRPRQRHVPGEENVLVYEPRGVAVIIAPWNFPLAILTGMTTAALVTGNTVVVKPAEQSSIIAAEFFALLAEAAVPAGVANLVPGIGEEVGAHLVGHADVALIAFTGSRAVGLEIVRQAAEHRQGQRTVKRVIAEMGGKNAIIVDDDADLDEAVKGIVASAFSYAGQKCSACSRVIVLRSAHDELVPRLVDATRSLRVGPADDPATVIGPLIDAAAREKVLGHIERGMQEGKLVCRVEHADPRGYFVGPVVFDHVPPDATIAREEIFGPVVAITGAGSFDEALALANATDYALTGGVYSRRPAHIERARRDFRVGNLYVNRPITAALVDRQPFGGFKLSGIGSKAGGPDYLRQFCDPKTIVENTMRHGLVPADDG